MTVRGFALFETGIGHCAIAWSDRGVACVQLPEPNISMLRARVLRRFRAAAESAPPPEIARAIDAIRSLLGGEAADLSGIELDLDDVPAFERAVYDVTRSIGPGRTLSYGEIAARVGTPRDARDVGQALGKNPLSHRRAVSPSGRGGRSNARLLR